jgi:tetratricopeptide (TPR) repeat protein
MRYLICAVLATLAVSPASMQTDRERDQARAHLRAGQEAMEIESWDVAEREFQAAIGLDPRLELAHYGLGQVYMNTKRYTKAIDAFVSSRNVFRANVADDQERGLQFERRVDEQLVQFRDMRRSLESGRVRSRDLRGSLRRIDDQIRQLERIRRRSHGAAEPIPPYIQIAVGSAYFRTGAFGDAEREWRQALEVDAGIGEVHNNLAVVCMLTGRYDEAEEEIQLAEKNGFRVSQGLKDDVKARKAGSRKRGSKAR